MLHALEIWVRLQPVLQVLQRTRLVELIRVRHAERKQRIQVVRVRVDGAALARDRRVVVVRVGVGLARHSI